MVQVLAEQDIPPEDTKARAALPRFRLSRIMAEGDPDFEPAYELLDGEFGAKGELERRDAIVGYFARTKDLVGYHLVVARDEAGQLAAVRDCHVSVDAQARIVVVFLSHVLVLPPYRRSGLGGLLRHLPVALGRRAAAALPPGPPPDVLLAAEMEPIAMVTSPEGGLAPSPDTLARLVAYGGAGYRIIDPSVLPYCQADYRDHGAIDADRPRPVPLLAVVRWIGHEDAREIPQRLAAAFVEHLYRIILSHCREKDLALPRAHTLGRLAAHEGSVALLDPPKNAHDHERLAPLARSRVLAYYPPGLSSGF
jgi:hypothetical protein